MKLVPKLMICLDYMPLMPTKVFLFILFCCFLVSNFFVIDFCAKIVVLLEIKQKSKVNIYFYFDKCVNFNVFINFLCINFISLFFLIVIIFFIAPLNNFNNFTPRINNDSARSITDINNNSKLNFIAVNHNRNVSSHLRNVGTSVSG